MEKRIVPIQHVLRTGHTVTLRLAVPEDAQQIVEHTTRVSAETNYLVTTPEEMTFTEEQERDWIVQHAKRPEWLLLVAVVKERIIGLLTFRNDSRSRVAHTGIFGISVQQAWHNHGIGRRLIQMLLEFATANPVIEKVSLEVFSSNEPGLHLYKSLGFREEGRRVQHVKFGPNDYVDSLLLYKWVQKKERP